MTNDELKNVIRTVVLAQGNDFIKELLRQHQIKIGTTKRDFAKNLIEAVDNGTLTEEIVENWLTEVEGWGNQHLYVFASPTIPIGTVSATIRASRFSELLEAPQSYEFPDDYALSAIDLDNQGVSLIWHIGKQSWPRVRARDSEREIDGDLFRFDAYRLMRERSVVRFLWRFDEGHCVILIHRNKDIDHIEAKAVVWQALREMGLCDAPRPIISLSEAVKTASRRDGTKQTRMEVDDGYVELKSTAAEGGINQVEAVRQARRAVNDEAFTRAQGRFAVRQNDDQAQPVSVEVAGEEGRIRIWAQCRRKFVHFVIDRIIRLNRAPADD